MLEYYCYYCAKMYPVDRLIVDISNTSPRNVCDNCLEHLAISVLGEEYTDDEFNEFLQGGRFKDYDIYYGSDTDEYDQYDTMYNDDEYDRHVHRNNK